jgi:DtxR family Mn-dependent transcriptional regulator
MEMSDGLELSPRKVEYLKYIFGKEGAVRTNEIASRFKVDPSTITKTMNELAESGLITHTPYHGVSLSGSGRQYAEFLIKRHRILSLMLTHFGLSRELACTEVSRFESFVTRSAIDMMCQAMGHPQQGICGKITHDEGCRHPESTAGQRNDRIKSGTQETT